MTPDDKRIEDSLKILRWLGVFMIVALVIATVRYCVVG